MAGLRTILRIAPFVVGLVAVRVWLRRRAAGSRALAPAPDAPRISPARRFEREPIDIVTVVDDLLLAGRQ
jgi:hypothetical protein